MIDPGDAVAPQLGGRKSGETPQEFQQRLAGPVLSLEDRMLGDPDAYFDQANARLDTIRQNAKWVGRAGRIGTLAAMEVPGMLVEATSKIAEMSGVISRDEIPEPWDFPDHVGNFFEGGLYTGFGFSALAVILSRREGGRSPNTNRKAALGAFVFSTLVQIIGEKYVRMGYNTGDMVDAAYGIAYSAGASAIGYVGYNRTDRKLQKYVDESEEILAKADEFNDKLSRLDDRSSGKETSTVVPNKAVSRQKKAKRKAQQASRKKNRR